MYVCPGSHYYVDSEEKAKFFWLELLKWSRLFHRRFPSLLGMCTCNVRSLSILVFENFVITCTSPLKVSSYHMPLSSAMAVALQKRIV